jgi:hypothetical protein
MESGRAGPRVGTLLVPDERRTALVGFATLTVLMASHAVRETARDALFLASVPATELPYAYLAIAALSAALLGWRDRRRRFAFGGERRRQLGGTLAAVGAIDVAFFCVVDRHATAELFALYVFSGVAVTVVTVQLWLLLDEAVTLERAPRIFGSVAAGGAFGAMLGSLLASGLVCVAPARALLLLAGALSLAASGLPFLLGGPRATPSVAPAQRDAFDDPFDELLRPARLDDAGLEASPEKTPYVRRLFGLVVVSTLALTAIDYVFKVELAATLPPEALGAFFAWFYAGLNAAALVVQLVLSGPLLRRLGVRRALATLPGLLLVAIVGFACAPGLVPVVLLKSADGVMRHSLHRTGMEVLHLPLAADVRSRSKGLIDGLGQRGGQALASVGVLAATRLGLAPTDMAWAIAALVALWLLQLAGEAPRMGVFVSDGGLAAKAGGSRAWSVFRKYGWGPSRSPASRPSPAKSACARPSASPRSSASGSKGERSGT